MGGICSNMNNNLYEQEKFVRRNIRKYNDRLGYKYSKEQIECKLRQVYNGSVGKKSGTFISDRDWRNVKKN